MIKKLIYQDETSKQILEHRSEWSFTITFGKTGTKGQSQTKEFDIEEKCSKEAEKLINEKLQKGYVEESVSPNEVAAMEGKTTGTPETLFFGGFIAPCGASARPRAMGVCVFVSSCGKGQTEAANNQPQQGQT